MIPYHRKDRKTIKLKLIHVPPEVALVAGCRTQHSAHTCPFQTTQYNFCFTVAGCILLDDEKAIDIFFFLLCGDHLKCFIIQWLPKWARWLGCTLRHHTSGVRSAIKVRSLPLSWGSLLFIHFFLPHLVSFVCFYKYKLVLNKMPYWSVDLKCFFSVWRFCAFWKLKQFTTTNTWLQMRQGLL